jgi:outer membrane lipoprotein-sorting protein
LKRFFLFGMALFFLSAESIQGQENPSRYLDSVTRQYSGLKDYTVDVRVHFDIEALKAPDMRAKLYYKSPDKMKVESKGVFFLPRGVGYFNPSAFKPEDFESRILERLTYEGRNAVRLQLTPKEVKRDSQRIVLTIDTDRSLILRIDTLTVEGREIRAAIDYGRFGDFELPTHIGLQLEAPPTEADKMKEFVPFAHKTQQVAGKVDITYSNYKVNSGLSDEIFKEAESQKSK